jgi:IclR family transcriptional regulator, pca regulon regulatory protein
MSTRTKKTTAPEAPLRGERLESLERGLRVLELFGHGESRAYSMIEIADRLQITRASALRILATLSSLGYIRLDGRAWSLTPRVLNLGYSYLAALGFKSIVQPILRELVRTTQETCSVGVLDATDVVYVAREETRRIIRIDLNVGSRIPAHLNSMGRVLLAALPDRQLDALLRTIKLERLTDRSVANKRELKERILRARLLGYCFIDGEIDDRIVGLATPIRDREGATVAALNLSLSGNRHPPEAIESTLLPLLIDATRQIESILHRDIPVES